MCPVDAQPLVPADAEGQLRPDERWEQVLAKPQLLADPVFPTENYLQALASGIFPRILRQLKAEALAGQVRVMKADSQMVMLIAQMVGFWAIDFEVASSRGVMGRDEFLWRVKEPILRPPPEMRAFTAEQHIIVKGVVQIQVQNQPPSSKEYQICKLRTVGWYVARLVSPKH
jgi:hypothetical protein